MVNLNTRATGSRANGSSSKAWACRSSASPGVATTGRTLNKSRSLCDRCVTIRSAKFRALPARSRTHRGDGRLLSHQPRAVDARARAGRDGGVRVPSSLRAPDAVRPRVPEPVASGTCPEVHKWLVTPMDARAPACTPVRAVTQRPARPAVFGASKPLARRAVMVDPA